MNIRLAHDSFRIRVSQFEARDFLSIGSCRERLALPALERGGMGKPYIEVTLTQCPGRPFHVRQSVDGIIAFIDPTELVELLGERPAREVALRETVAQPDGSVIEVLFEIDLFSRKDRGKGAQDASARA